jgi:hypothetical protein
MGNDVTETQKGIIIIKLAYFCIRVRIRRDWTASAQSDKCALTSSYMVLFNIILQNLFWGFRWRHLPPQIPRYVFILTWRPTTVNLGIHQRNMKRSIDGVCHSESVVEVSSFLRDPTEKVPPSPSPEDGNRSSFRNAEFSSYSEFRTADKVQKRSS